jgi:hypothetical protein
MSKEAGSSVPPQAADGAAAFFRKPTKLTAFLVCLWQQFDKANWARTVALLDHQKFDS